MEQPQNGRMKARADSSGLVADSGGHTSDVSIAYKALRKAKEYTTNTPQTENAQHSQSLTSSSALTQSRPDLSANKCRSCSIGDTIEALVFLISEAQANLEMD